MARQSPILPSECAAHSQTVELLSVVNAAMSGSTAARRPE